MRKMFCLALALCLFTSLAFGQVPLERRNYIVERSSRLYLLPISGIFGYGSYFLWVEAEKPANKDHEVAIKVGSGIWGAISLIFFLVAITPTKTYLFPYLEPDGTIWLQKEIGF